ncbi:hypothetical protein ACFYXS_02750 [Streptomyces sp. NPDC002574]|uniref:hypothetical protein n=1 Tax=Streptomyces sp. NPDC002574 TaxID=3364652 RepID=UPI0036933C03
MSIYECFICGTPQESRTCPQCFSRIRGVLAQLPEQYAYLLASRQPRQGGPGDGRGGKRLHAPLPGREDTLNMLGPAARQSVTDGRDQVGPTPFAAVLEGWCEAVSYERGLSARYTEGLMTVRRDVTSMTRRLTDHLDWISQQDWVPDFFEEIQELLTATKRITLTEPRRVAILGVLCPSCGEQRLMKVEASGWAAQCRDCPAVKFDDHDYDRLIKDRVRGLQELLGT